MTLITCLSIYHCGTFKQSWSLWWIRNWQDHLSSMRSVHHWGSPRSIFFLEKYCDLSSGCSLPFGIDDPKSRTALSDLTVALFNGAKSATLRKCHHVWQSFLQISLPLNRLGKTNGGIQAKRGHSTWAYQNTIADQQWVHGYVPTSPHPQEFN